MREALPGLDPQGVGILQHPDQSVDLVSNQAAPPPELEGRTLRSHLSQREALAVLQVATQVNASLVTHLPSTFLGVPVALAVRELAFREGRTLREVDLGQVRDTDSETIRQLRQGAEAGDWVVLNNYGQVSDRQWEAISYATRAAEDGLHGRLSQTDFRVIKIGSLDAGT
ncbi:MAG: hypothetical protein AB1758_00275 [Candidatus Eremiobacterota bacterium]